MKGKFVGFFCFFFGGGGVDFYHATKDSRASGDDNSM